MSAQRSEQQQEKPTQIKKIRSIVVDTFTAFQKKEILSKWEHGKASQDDWKDYGTDICLFINRLVERGFTCVGILGYEGTGKTFGMKYLEPGTNIWYNADGKNPTFKGGKQVYGTIAQPTIYMKLPSTYDEVIRSIDKTIAGGHMVAEPVAFLIGHIEDYKSTDGRIRQRLRTLGKLTKTMNVEDMLTMCYYTDVMMEGDKPVYRFRTQNSGSDTCRTMEQMHETLYIPNNFQMILDAIENY